METLINNELSSFVRKVYDLILKRKGWRGLSGDQFADLGGVIERLKKLKN